METNTTVRIKGMTCGGCVASVERVLKALPGVSAAEVSLEKRQASIRHDGSLVSAAQFRAAIEGAGFEVV